MRVIKYLIYVYMFLRPYYFFKSGGLQISDIFIIMAFVLYLLLKRSGVSFENKKKAIKENYGFILFFLLSTIINVLHFIIFPDYKFLLSSLYFAFNLIAILLFSYCIYSDEKFVKGIRNILFFNLIVQLFICILNKGRYYDATRYMGTFNDPNQFGYFILLVCAYVYLLSCKEKNKKNSRIILFNFIISGYLIVRSSSTGMILGYSSILFLYMFDYFKSPIKFLINYFKKIVIIFVFSIPLVTLIVLLFNINIKNLKQNILSSNLSIRIQEKLNKATEKSDLNIWEDRALDYIQYYPQYLIYGAGEGAERNYPLVNKPTEIHSTFPAIMFYYGIIPTLILLSWIYKKLKKLKLRYLIPYIAILVESFTLANQRQVLFWVFFCFATTLKTYCDELEEKNENRNIATVTK